MHGHDDAQDDAAGGQHDSMHMNWQGRGWLGQVAHGSTTQGQDRSGARDDLAQRARQTGSRHAQ
ncbi:hypothetical protein E2562_000198 [Oryza meyeriana var. granulata]|uniref:Uncharacterized protein n=1 Tax=Oryza meyeriana var. granulata TaxID=110450 RepID=A0A6G1DAX7_9ORYZ|nr:hypothetical protein E2562_000198 [Oryza meyeriana var. granulata]